MATKKTAPKKVAAKKKSPAIKKTDTPTVEEQPYKWEMSDDQRECVMETYGCVPELKDGKLPGIQKPEDKKYRIYTHRNPNHKISYRGQSYKFNDGELRLLLDQKNFIKYMDQLVKSGHIYLKGTEPDDLQPWKELEVDGASTEQLISWIMLAGYQREAMAKLSRKVLKEFALKTN